jgi:hypothetical protein
MLEKPVMSEEIFAAMLDRAIQDLRDSGMGTGEIFTIVEECFGSVYARRFCGNSTDNKTGYQDEGISSTRKRGDDADPTAIREQKHPGPRPDQVSPSAGEPPYHQACLRPSLSPFQRDGTGASENRV